MMKSKVSGLSKTVKGNMFIIKQTDRNLDLITEGFSKLN
jgi:hypothetical protein